MAASLVLIDTIFVTHFEQFRPLMNDFLRKMAKFYPWQISIGLRCQRWNKDQILYS